MNQKNILKSLAQNPLAILMLGACPAMAQTGSVTAALGMGGAVLVVLVLSSILISALRNLIPEKGQFLCHLIIVAGFACAVYMLMNALLPNVYNILGFHLAILAVDLMEFWYAEEAGKNSVGKAFLASLVTGLLFALMLFIMGTVREIFGSGSFLGMEIPFLKTHTVSILTKAPGGFLVYAVIAAIVNKLASGNKEVA